MIGEVPDREEVTKFVSNNRSGDIKQYLDRLGSFLQEFKSMGQEFLQCASVGAGVLGAVQEDPSSLNKLPPLDSLLSRSSGASPHIARFEKEILRLRQWISFGRSYDLKTAADADYKRAYGDAVQGLGDLERAAETLRKQAQASLDNIESSDSPDNPAA